MCIDAIQFDRKVFHSFNRSFYAIMIKMPISFLDFINILDASVKLFSFSKIEIFETIIFQCQVS